MTLAQIVRIEDDPAILSSDFKTDRVTSARSSVKQIFPWLVQGTAVHLPSGLKTNPRFDPLRADIRFQDPLVRLKFPEVAGDAPVYFS